MATTAMASRTWMASRRRTDLELRPAGPGWARGSESVPAMDSSSGQERPESDAATDADATLRSAWPWPGQVAQHALVRALTSQKPARKVWTSELPPEAWTPGLCGRSRWQRVDGGLLLFPLDGWQVATGGVHSGAVVPGDPAKDCGAGLGASAVVRLVDEFDFEGGEPGLGDGVVQARAGSAHRAAQHGTRGEPPCGCSFLQVACDRRCQGYMFI